MSISGNSLRLFRLKVAKYIRLLCHPRMLPPLRFGVMPSVEHYHVPFSSKVRSVIDVGVSDGQFSLFALNRWPGVQILGFEPLRESIERAEKVLPTSTNIVEAALSSFSGTKTFHVSGRRDSSSLMPIGKQAEEFAGTQTVEKVQVKTAALDDFDLTYLKQPWLMKVDVQGAELEVLRGAQQTLKRVEEIYCECSFEKLYDGQALASDVVAYLHGAGFDLCGIFNSFSGSEGRPIQADFWFRKRPYSSQQDASGEV